MKILSWNVNGIRAALKKGFMEFLTAHDPDIICIQETKASPEQVELELPGREMYWNSAVKKGYSGTAIFTRHAPLSVDNGIGVEEHDQEGRVITLEFESFFLVTVYTPNAQRGLTRLEYRSNEWDPAFLNHVSELQKTKPVVFCGDLNVAHQEIDLANPQSNRKNAGFTDEERAGFDRIVEAGFVDIFREFEKGPGHYTWWSYMANARERNVGWRIDYFCVSASILEQVKEAYILPDVMGSDHCPIGVNLSV